MKNGFKPIKFPADELPHDKIIEWWYFNGLLTDEDGNQFSFMHAFFKANPRKVKLPLMNKLPVSSVYFEHSMITDIKRQEFYSSVNPICVPLPDHNSAPLIFFHFLTRPGAASYLSEVKPFFYPLKAENFDIFMESAKPPLLENQTGFLEVQPGRTTWYYSLTQLKTEGYITVKGKRRKVSGLSWHDHQWADAPYANDFWIWFSLQLKNGLDIVCFEYGRDRKTKLASIIDKNSIQKTYPVEIVPGNDSWVSSVTGATYPQVWRINIPEKKIEIVVKSLNRNQEINYGTINYWEGGLSVEARISGRIVKGQGFAELVGFPRQKKLAAIYQQRFKAEFMKKWNGFGKEAKKQFGKFI